MMIRRTIEGRARRAAALLLVPLLLVFPGAGAVGARQAAPLSGVTGPTSYVSPQFGYAVGWAAPWVVWTGTTSSDRERGYDKLSLEFADTTVELSSQRNYAGETPAALLRQEFDAFARAAVAFDLRLLGRSERAGAATTEFAWTAGGDALRTLWEYHRAPSGAVVWLRVSGPPADFPAAVAELRRTLTLDGAPFVVGDVRSAAEFAATLTSGVAGTRFESPTYGFGLAWDPDAWTVEEDAVAAGPEREDFVDLAAAAGSGSIEVSGFAFSGGPGDCLADATATLTRRGDGRLIPALGPDGTPIAGTPAAGGAAGGAFAAFTGEIDGEPLAAYVECRALGPGEAVLLVLYLGPPETFAADFPAVRAVLATITMPASAGAIRATPASGLTGPASYVSPQFGYAVAWAAPWTIVDDGRAAVSDPEDGYDTLILAFGETKADLSSSLDWAGASPAALLEPGLGRVLRQTDFRLVGGSERDGAASAEFAWEDDGTAYRGLIEVSRAPTGAVVRLVVAGPAEEFPAAVASLRRTVTLDGAPFVGDVLSAADFAATSAPATPANGIAGNRFVSPTYGYELAWDEGRWPISLGGVAPGQDRVDSVYLATAPDIRSATGIGTLIVAGAPLYGGDPGVCLTAVAEDLTRSPEVARVAPAAGPGGTPVAGAAAGAAFAAYTFEFGGRPRAAYYECRTLVPGEAVLFALYVGPAETFTADLVAVRTVLATLVLPGAASASPAAG